jgi:hypothetical protein
VAIDARGNAFVTWEQRVSQDEFRTAYRWLLAGRGWTATRYLPAGRRIEDLEISARGDLAVIAADGGPAEFVLSVGAARPGAELGDWEPVPGASAAWQRAGIGIDDAGAVSVAWSSYASREVFVSSRRANGRFGAAQQVGGDDSGGWMEVVVSPGGAAAVMFVARRGGRTKVVYRPPAGSFGWEEDPGLPGMGSARIAMDPTGRAVVTSDAIVPFVGQEDYNATGDARFAVRSPLGDFQVHDIARHGVVYSVVMDPRGAATFIVNARDTGSRVVAVTTDAAGRVGAPVELSGAGSSPAGGINVRGDVMAGWLASVSGPDSAVAISERPVGGEFGAARLFGGGKVGSVQLALNDAGHAAVAWLQDDDGGNWNPTVRVATRADDAAPPPPPDVAIHRDPSAALDERGAITVPASCSESCRLSPTGIIHLGGDELGIAGRGKSRRLSRRKRGRLSVVFGAGALKEAREAIAAGRRPWISVTVSARGRSPRPTLATRRLRVRLP